MPGEIESLKTDRGTRPGERTASPMLTALAVLGLLLAAHAHWRLGQVAARDDRLRDQLVEMRGVQSRIEGQQQALTSRLDSTIVAWRSELQGLRDVEAQARELGRGIEELRARTESPQRAWVGAESLYLMELAERRLNLERDVATAIVAMEAADARLAMLDEPAIAPIRQQLAKELAALRAVAVPDIAAILQRISALESQAPRLPVMGIPVSKGRREQTAATSPDGLARARARVSEATRDLFSLRRVDPATARLVTLEEESLRRQHLELLLFSARIAATQQDGIGYRAALESARAWLGQYFDPGAPSVVAADAELAELAGITVDPRRPGIGEAARMLERTSRAAAAARR